MAVKPDPKAPDLGALASADEFRDNVREVAPEIAKWVEASYDKWKTAPTKWRTVVQPTKAAAEYIVEEARHYTGKIRETPLTVQVRQIDEDAKTGTATLVYRVRDRVNSGRKPK